MAERSYCGKVDIKCRDCGRKIKQCRSSEDGDNCNDKTIELCDPEKNYSSIKKINILSELLVDRKNKFLFVGDGNFSFTVAFNAYRQFLSRGKYNDPLLGAVNQQHFRNYAYAPWLMVVMLIHLHRLSITCAGEVIERLRKLLTTHRACTSERKLAKNANV